MAMMAMMWGVIFGIFVSQMIHANAIDEEVTDDHQQHPFAPIVLSDLSAGDQDVWLAFTRWTAGQPSSWMGEAMKIGSVAAQQRWCFVVDCHFQPTNVFWRADEASPLGQLNITLTCPDAGEMGSRFQNVIQDEMLSAKDEFARAQTFAKIRAAKRKKASLEALLQLLSESREQEAAAQALNDGSQHSEPLRLAAQAVMDASVQSSFHQFRVASRVFLILPLVRAVDPSSSESDGLAGAIVKFIHGGHLAWQSGEGEEMAAGICHTDGADVIVLNSLKASSSHVQANMETTTIKNFKAAVPTGGSKVKLHVVKHLDTYNPMQLKKRKYVFAAAIGAILVLPLLLVMAVAVPKGWVGRGGLFATLILQGFCVIAPPTAARFGLVDCGVGMAWEMHTAFAVLVAVYASSRLADAEESYFKEKANGKMCLNRLCCLPLPPLPYLGFETLVKIEFYFLDYCMERFDFYSDVVFVCLAYSCQWQWAHLTAGLLVVATLGQAAGVAVGAGRPNAMYFSLLGAVPHAALALAWSRSPAVVAGHALARVLLEDLPQVALQILFSQEVRRDPFVLMSAGVSIFFGLKKLYELINFFCPGEKDSYSSISDDGDDSD